MNDRRSLLAPRAELKIGAFNVLSLKSETQKTELAIDFTAHKLDICALSETRIDGESKQLIFPPHGTFDQRITLRTTGFDAETPPSKNNNYSSGQAGVGFALSVRANQALISWHPISPRICAASFEGRTRIRAPNEKDVIRPRGKHSRRALFIVAVYAPHEASTTDEKDQFYVELEQALDLAGSGDIVIMAGDTNASVGRLQDQELGSVGGRWSLCDVDRTNNGDRILELCGRHKLYLASTHFRHSRMQTQTFKPPGTTKGRQLDHVAITKRWSNSLVDCRSYWSTARASDHALVITRFCMTFAKRTTEKKRPTYNVRQLNDPNILEQFHAKCCSVLDGGGVAGEAVHLLQEGGRAPPAVSSQHQSCSRNMDGESVVGETVHLLQEGGGAPPAVSLQRRNLKWSTVSEALLNAAIETCSVKNKKHYNEHVSQETIAIIKERQHTKDSEYRKELTTAIRRSSKNDRNEFWAAKTRQIDSLWAAGNSHEAWKLIGELTYRQRASGDTGVLLKADGQSKVTSDVEVLERMREHFEKQFDFPQPSEPPPDSDFRYERTEVVEVSIEPPTMVELRHAISRLKPGKAAGPDGVKAELIKQAPPVVFELLHEIVVECWANERVPTVWKTSELVPIHKKGSREDCNNYRGINLLCVAVKVLEAIIAARLAASRETILREEQAGFRTGRGTTDHIHTLRQILQHRQSFARPTLIAFLDIRGAFDSASRERLLKVLEGRGVPPKICRIIRELYTGQQTSVRSNNVCSAPFSPKSGVWQGGVLSPFLFMYPMERAMEEVDCDLPNSGLVLHGYEPSLMEAELYLLRSLEFADDIALLAETTTDLQAQLSATSMALNRDGMTLAPHKCAVIAASWTGAPPIVYLNGQALPVVDKFTYLGCVITPDGQCLDDIKRRITRAAATFQGLQRVWSSNKISMAIKGRVYESCVRSTLLYGCESWTLRTKDINPVKVFDNRKLRQIARIWWEHRATNKSVQQKVFGHRANEVGDIELVIRRTRLRWLGHVARMSKGRLPWLTLTAGAPTDWKRPQHHSNLTTWRKDMRKETAPITTDFTINPRQEVRENYSQWLEAIRQLAADRTRWRQLTHEIVTTTNNHSTTNQRINVDTSKMSLGEKGRRASARLRRAPR
jgi:hypothetical protein